MRYTVLCGDVSEVLPTLAPESFDAVLCDPPYGLSFMQKIWDHGVPSREVWEAVARTLKPGAHLMAFGGDRTHHRLMVAIEDAGFEIRTCIYWLTGQGFPKSHQFHQDPKFCQCGELGRSGESTGRERPPSSRICTEPASTDGAPLPEGASRSMHTEQDSPAGCPPDCGSGDAQPLLDSGDDQASPPSQECVQGRTHSGETLGAPACESGRSPSPVRCIDRLSSLDSALHDCGASATPAHTEPSTLPADTCESEIRKQGIDQGSSCLDYATGLPCCKACGRPLPDRWRGYGTALKPAAEICTLAMKPTDGTFAENAIRWGVAGLAIDDCRIGTDKAIPNGTRSGSLGKEGTSGYQGGWGAREATQSGCNPNLGRWPANVILDEDAARALDEMSGERRAGNSVSGDEPSIPAMHDGGLKRVAFSSHGDTGGASRFFYCAKSSRREREAGLEGFEDGPGKVAYGKVRVRECSVCGTRTKESGPGGRWPNCEHDEWEWKDERAGGHKGTTRNRHPCVKPLALCEYLARLILPPKRDTPRRLLVPFSGSGSEMIGALLAGWDEVVGIEREAEYVAIAEARLRHWTDGAQLELSA